MLRLGAAGGEMTRRGRERRGQGRGKLVRSCEAGRKIKGEERKHGRMPTAGRQV